MKLYLFDFENNYLVKIKNLRDIDIKVLQK